MLYVDPKVLADLKDAKLEPGFEHAAIEVLLELDRLSVELKSMEADFLDRVKARRAYHQELYRSQLQIN